MSIPDDQQFCLRWNNFQANITSQFETLRDDEDFVDVTLACEGQRLEAHKVVLSACSPFFKELFKSNPCPHPIIFMRDVEARHIVALLEFMYAGEVNVAQAHLSAFLRTAESLQIRGLTDASRAHKENNKGQKPSENSQQSSSSCHNTQQSSTHNNKSNQQSTSANKSSASSQQESVKSSSKSQHNHSSKTHQRQQSPNGNSQTSGLSPERHRPAPKSESPRSPPNSPPPSKKHKSETTSRHQTSNDLTENNRVNERLNNGSDLSSVAAAAINPFAVHGGLHQHLHSELDLTSDIIEPKVELPDYASDDDMRTESRMTDSILGLEGPNTGHPFASLHGGMEIIPGTSGINMTDVSQDSTQAAIQCDSSRKLHSLDPRPCPACGRVYSNLSNLRQHMRLIHHPQYVTCPLCAKPFKTTLYLKRHLVSFHDSVSADVTVNKTKDSSSSSSCTQYSSTPAVQSSVADIKQSIYGKKTDAELNSANENVDLYNSEQSRAFMDSNAFQQNDTQTTYDLQNLDEFSPNDLGISSIDYKE